MIKRDIAILGGGINGLTCGLRLQQAGYRSTLITAREWQPEADDPGFASLYPASSVKPVTVKSPILNDLLRTSQERFKALLNVPGSGVKQQMHYEVYEAPEAVPVPDYANEMINFRVFGRNELLGKPVRKRGVPTSGWCYEVLFADTPVYMPWLKQSYVRAGGEITSRSLSHHEVSTLPEELIVNCTGVGSIRLFEDSYEDIRLVKGHQIIIHAADIPSEYLNPGFSYNYTVGKEMYRNPDGSPADVYFYPRSDCWILGGSRQECISRPDGTFREVPQPHSMHITGGCGVPEPMYRINREIIKETIGLNIEKLPLHGRYGYRFIRKERGLRLEAETVNGKTIIHNYGHGGAGVTLSWGCAEKVLEIISGL